MKQKLEVRKRLRWLAAKKYRLIAATVIGIGISAGIVGGGYALILGGSAAPVNNASVNLSQGLIGYWPMTGNANDASGNGNNGTVNGATLTTDRSSYPNQAYSFNGSSNYIDFGSNGLLQPNYLTWSMWIKPTAVSNDQMFFSEGSADYMRLLGSKLRVDIYSNGTTHLTSAGSCSVQNNTWSHVATTFDGSVINVYLNGILCSSATATGTAGSYNSSLKLGSYSGPSSYFAGTIDDFRYYNRALSAAEVKALANPPTLNAASGESGLLGEWKLDGNAKDATPRGNNCTAHNTVATATDRKGQANSAYGFNGSNAYLDCGAPPALQVSNSLTVSAWVYSSNWASSATMNGVVNYGNGGYWLYVTPTGAVAFYVQHAPGPVTDTLVSTATLSTGVWHHIVGTYTTSTESVYIDGQLDHSQTSSVNGINDYQSYDLQIGSNKTTSGRYFNGSIDDVRIYDRALSATEVSSLYKSYNSQIYLGGSGTTGSVSLGKGLIGSWGFNGSALDSTPYSNNGTVSGATLTTDRKGRSNSAYSFNGTSNYISFTKPAKFDPSNDFTISTWVRSNTNFSSGVYSILSQQDGTGTGRILLYVDSSYSQTLISYLGGTVTAGNVNLTAGNWYLATLVHSGNTSTMYTNTSAGPVKTLTSNAATGNIIVGANKSYGNVWSGSIDDVRIWNRALNAAEVSALYNEYR